MEDGSQIFKVDEDGQERLYLLRRFSERGSQQLRVKREIRQAKLLRHPSAAPVVDYFEADGVQVVVFEHVDSLRLDQIMAYLVDEGERLADAATWAVARQLFDVLAAAHELTGADGRTLHMVHGTLGPDRIYVTWDGEVRVYGIGLSSLFDDEHRDEDALVYQAPEARTGGRPVVRGDVYSAALIIWALLTHRQPEVGVAPENVARFCPEMPIELARSLDNALQS